MQPINQRVSPQAFSKIQEELLVADIMGEDRTREIMCKYGLLPVPTRLVVDYAC